MSRSRAVSTDISRDRRLAPLVLKNPLAGLIYTWAIPHADDWGRLPGDASEFALLVCPALFAVVDDIEEAIEQIAQTGLWQRYEVAGTPCIAFPREVWFKRQNYINAEKRLYDGSKLPAPPEETWMPWEDRPSVNRGKNTVDTGNHAAHTQGLPQNAKNPQGLPQNPSSPSPTPSPTDVNTAQESIRDAPQDEPADAVPPTHDPVSKSKRAAEKREYTAELAAWFDEELWPLYPRKVEKQAAFAVLARLRPDDALRDAIKAGLRRAVESASWQEALETREMRYIPHPDTWLRHRRWEDEPEPPRAEVPVSARNGSPRASPPVSRHEAAMQRNREGDERYLEAVRSGDPNAFEDPLVRALASGEVRLQR